ncbi:MAG: hypothetical protein LBC61_05180 [Candidatus Peribacteria bacterium]|nr:hypothetical protein [Candidatus Peribacteria bacterium]
MIFVENNYSGQLENYIVKEFGLSTPIPQPLSPSQEERGGNESLLKISHLRKYDLMPFYLEDFNSLK